LTVGRLPTARVPTAPTRTTPTAVITAETSPASDVTPDRYTVQSGESWAEIAERFTVGVEALQNANSTITTLTPGQTLLIPVPTPFPLLVQPPTCYETRPGSLLCLGRVDNPLTFPVESVTLEVRLVQDDGSVFQSERSTIEQVSIPSGSFAPYQATFEAHSGDFASADARLISATQGAEDRFVLLLVQDVKGALLDGRILVNATIYNPGPQNAEILRVFVTLLDSAERVIGYRVVNFDGGITLDTGAHLPLSMELTPQAFDTAPDYALYVEARPVEE
jgi:LysM repeat protein